MISHPVEVVVTQWWMLASFVQSFGQSGIPNKWLLDLGTLIPIRFCIAKENNKLLTVES